MTGPAKPLSATTPLSTTSPLYLSMSLGAAGAPIAAVTSTGQAVLAEIPAAAAVERKRRAAVQEQPMATSERGKRERTVGQLRFHSPEAIYLQQFGIAFFSFLPILKEIFTVLGFDLSKELGGLTPHEILSIAPLAFVQAVLTTNTSLKDMTHSFVTDLIGIVGELNRVPEVGAERQKIVDKLGYKIKPVFKALEKTNVELKYCLRILNGILQIQNKKQPESYYTLPLTYQWQPSKEEHSTIIGFSRFVGLIATSLNKHSKFIETEAQRIRTEQMGHALDKGRMLKQRNHMGSDKTDPAIIIGKCIVNALDALIDTNEALVLQPLETFSAAAAIPPTVQTKSSLIQTSYIQHLLNCDLYLLPTWQTKIEALRAKLQGIHHSFDKSLLLESYYNQSQVRQIAQQMIAALANTFEEISKKIAQEFPGQDLNKSDPAFYQKFILDTIKGVPLGKILEQCTAEHPHKSAFKWMHQAITQIINDYSAQMVADTTRWKETSMVVLFYSEFDYLKPPFQEYIWSLVKQSFNDVTTYFKETPPINMSQFFSRLCQDTHQVNKKESKPQVLMGRHVITTTYAKLFWDLDYNSHHKQIFPIMGLHLSVTQNAFQALSDVLKIGHRLRDCYLEDPRQFADAEAFDADAEFDLKASSEDAKEDGKTENKGEHKRAKRGGKRQQAPAKKTVTRSAAPSLYRSMPTTLTATHETTLSSILSTLHASLIDKHGLNPYKNLINEPMSRIDAALNDQAHALYSARLTLEMLQSPRCFQNKELVLPVKRSLVKLVKLYASLTIERGVSAKFFEMFPGNVVIYHDLLFLFDRCGFNHSFRVVRDLQTETLTWRYPSPSDNLNIPLGRILPSLCHLLSEDAEVDIAASLEALKKEILAGAVEGSNAQESAPKVAFDYMQTGALEGIRKTVGGMLAALNTLQSSQGLSKGKKSVLRQLIKHVECLQDTVQLFALFPEQRYLMIHMNHLLLAAQYATETTGRFLFIARGMSEDQLYRQMRTKLHDLGMYCEKVGLDSLLSPKEKELLMNLNVGKAGECPHSKPTKSTLMQFYSELIDWSKAGEGFAPKGSEKESVDDKVAQFRAKFIQYAQTITDLIDKLTQQHIK